MVSIHYYSKQDPIKDYFRPDHLQSDSLSSQLKELMAWVMGNRVFSNNVVNSSKQLWDEEYERFTRELCSPIKTKFQDEYTLIFFRSNTSWHSFEYKQNDIGPRFSLNINFNFPEIVQ